MFGCVAAVAVSQDLYVSDAVADSWLLMFWVLTLELKQFNFTELATVLA